MPALSKRIEQAIKAVGQLPVKQQDSLADDLLHWIEADVGIAAEITDAECAELAIEAAAARCGELASDAEVAALVAKHGL